MYKATILLRDSNMREKKKQEEAKLYALVQGVKDKEFFCVSLYKYRSTLKKMYLQKKKQKRA